MTENKSLDTIHDDDLEDEVLDGINGGRYGRACSPSAISAK